MRERRAEAAHHLVLRQTAGRLASDASASLHAWRFHLPPAHTNLTATQPTQKLTGDVSYVQTVRNVRRCSGRSYATRLIGPPLHSVICCSNRIYKNGFYFKNVQKKLQKARCSGAKRAFRELGPLKSVFLMTRALGKNHTLFSGSNHTKKLCTVT